MATTKVTSGVFDVAVMLQGEKELWVPAGAMIPRITNGPSSGLTESSTNKVMSRTLDFDASTLEYAQFGVMFPNSWDGGTVRLKYIWTAASGSGGVLFSCAAVALADSDPLDTAFGTVIHLSDTFITALDWHTTSVTGPITIAGSPGDDAETIFQIYRFATNGADTLAVDVKLRGVKIRYTVDAGNDA